MYVYSEPSLTVFYFVLNLKPCEWTENGDSWDFVCQHGPDECLGNKAQVAVLVYEGGAKICFTFVEGQGFKKGLEVSKIIQRLCDFLSQKE